MTTTTLLETSLFRHHSSCSFEFKCEFESPAKTRFFSPVNGKRGFRSLRVRCVSDDPGSRSVFVSSRRKMVVLLSTVQLLSQFPQNGKADDIYSVMRNEIRKVVTKGKAAGVLRLVFHDAGTFELDDNTGMPLFDGLRHIVIGVLIRVSFGLTSTVHSSIYEGMNDEWYCTSAFEFDKPSLVGLTLDFKVVSTGLLLMNSIDLKMQVLTKAKINVDAIQPVSWADMISVAGSEAVSICGGPTIPVVLGRLDSTQPDPEDKLPPETLTALGLKECFKRKGFSTQELVALSGAHTIGSKGFGEPTVFDNAYYKILLAKPWTSTSKMTSMVGLPSDHALVDDDECLRWVKLYAEDQDKFFNDFTSAYVKLVNSGAKWKML